MKNTNFINLMLLLLLVGCTDAFYQHEILNDQQEFLIASDWQKKDFWIDSQSIVFDMEVEFKADESFEMIISALDKKDTMYKKLLRSGKWTLDTEKDQLILDYQQNSGIIGYYLNGDKSEEVYRINTTDKEIQLLNETDEQVFELVLSKI